MSARDNRSRVLNEICIFRSSVDFPRKRTAALAAYWQTGPKVSAGGTQLQKGYFLRTIARNQEMTAESHQATAYNIFSIVSTNDSSPIDIL
jgi:uncharacterized protein (DUF2267 family)